MDRVLSRRSYLSYTDDHNIKSSSIPQQNTIFASDTNSDTRNLNQLQSLRRDVYSMSREAAQSSTEMGRCLGELNKAKAALGERFSCKKII